MGGAGKQNKNQKMAQLSQQGTHNNVEFGADTQYGNAQHQSQKKSGKQLNKK